MLKKEQIALIQEMDKVIKSLNNRLSHNRYELRKLAEDNRVIKRELTICIGLKNQIKKGKV
jgi:hypothetical protein